LLGSGSEDERDKDSEEVEEVEEESLVFIDRRDFPSLWDVPP